MLVDVVEDFLDEEDLMEGEVACSETETNLKGKMKALHYL